MSDAEAREKRRNRLLNAKENRMSKILGSMDSSSITSTDEAPGVTPSNVSSSSAPKKLTPKSTATSSSATKSPLTPSLQPANTNEEKQQDQKYQEKTREMTQKPAVTRGVHTLIVMFSGILFQSLAAIVARSPCILPVYFNCDIIRSNLYAILVCLFCLMESEEFLFGRLSKADGTPIDVSLLFKDFALFAFAVIMSSKITAQFF